ncbi:MAG: M1 family metallopeptidase [Gemmatimonadetes bacterium]|nr:M1 family metallopeptidase [Gemmatimonadota bacterium]
MARWVGITDSNSSARRLLLPILLLAGCGAPPRPVHPTPSAPTPAAADSAGAAPELGAAEPAPAAAPRAVPPAAAVQPIPMPPSFAAALEAGTRTLRGVPGPRYWQQRVSYRIAAELDPRTARLQAEETITYFNQSPDTLGTLVLHLYQNLFRGGEARNRRVPVTGGMIVERVAVEGWAAARADGSPEPAPGQPAYRIAGTLLWLRLGRPLLPGDSLALELAWRFTVPPQGAPRTGHIDRIVYHVAQWYPQVAVYDDVDGWHTDPYLGEGEFYLEYGDFDVSLTLPEGWLVAATGELQNAEEVLPEPVRQRLRLALESDTVVHVVSAEERGSGKATQQAPGGQLTWEFRARRVRDFAFAASSRYVWDATRARSPPADSGALPGVVAVHALYRPQAGAWRQAARYARHALEFHSGQVHAYVYPQITAAEGPVGGMEYPMLVFVRAFNDSFTLYSVLAHEVGHQWYPMMVGSDEPEFAWQDEGLATYIENLAAADLFPGAEPFAGDHLRYLALAGTDQEQPMMRHADRYAPGLARVVASYSKPALALRALGEVVGDSVLREGLREYTRRWLFRHPMPLDFFHTLEEVAGRDLDWFWLPWWFETAVLDQAVTAVDVAPDPPGERVSVTVENQGGLALPAELVLTLASGETRRVVVPVDVWLMGGRRHTETLAVPAAVLRIEIDPDQSLPDVDRRDNVWERGK